MGGWSRVGRPPVPPENDKMIEVYSWATPNGHKVHIMLEECGLPYRVHAIDIGAGDQFKPEFLAISPNNKIPAIVDPDGPDGKPISLFESGAILMYLAAKSGRFMPESTRGKYEVLQWLMFQMGSVGPMLGQTHHFRIYAPEKIAVRDRPLHQRSEAAVRRDGQAARQLALHRGAGATPSPTSPSFRGCAHGRTRASTGPTIRISRAGSTRSRPAPRCSAASPCWPTRASRSPTRRRARCCSAPSNTGAIEAQPQRSMKCEQ